MAYAQHAAQLDQPEGEGATMGDHLEVAARHGVAHAIAALNGPQMPDELAYLYLWAQSLHGFAPLNPQVIESWSRLHRITLHPWEVDALMGLDVVLSHPDKPGEEG